MEPPWSTTAASAPAVLIVDDDDDNRYVYASFLRFKGFRVATASSGFEALVATQSSRPDLIILDLAMPGLDGWEVTRRLKEDPTTRDIPIIAVTAYDDPNARRRAGDAGIGLYITKPCAPTSLLAAMEQLLPRLGGQSPH